VALSSLRLLLAVGGSALIFSGCGGPVVDQSRLNSDLTRVIETSLGVEVREADCPAGISLEVPQAFECRVDFKAQGSSRAKLQLRAEAPNRRAAIRVIGMMRE
jgi:hypothetical protein